MSSDDHRFIDPNDPLYYAPCALRDRVEDPEISAADDRQGRGTRSPYGEGAPLYESPLYESSPYESSRRDRSDVFVEAVAQALEESRQAGPVEVPYVLRRKPGHLRGVLISISVAAIAVAAVVVFFVAPASHVPGQSDGAIGSLSTIMQSLKISLFAPPPPRVVPTLTVQGSSGIVNESVKLAIDVTSPPAGASVAIMGLPPGSRLTTGRRVGAGEWRIPVSELATTSVIPPDEFVGQASVTAELRGADGTALARDTLRLAWTSVWRPTAPPVNVAPPPPPPPPVPQENIRTMTPGEIASFIGRGEQLLESGDLQATRLLFRRAADARNPRAALALGKTYDPLFLRQFGGGGPTAEPETARHWYQKSKEWGDPSAQTHLDALATMGR